MSRLGCVRIHQYNRLIMNSMKEKKKKAYLYIKGLYNNSEGLKSAVASNKTVLQLQDGLVLFLTQRLVVLRSLWLGL